MGISADQGAGQAWHQRPLVRWSLIAVAAVLIAHAIAAIVLFGLQRTYQDEVLPHVSIDGRDVSGLDRDELVAAVGEHVDDRLRAPIEVDAGLASLTTDRASVGLEVTTEPATDAAWSYGREGFYRALIDQIEARRGVPLPLALRPELDESSLEEWAQESADWLSQDASSAGIELVVIEAPDEVEVRVTEPVDGQRVAPDDLIALIRQNVDDDDDGAALDLEVEPAEERAPTVTGADLDAILPSAESAVSASATLIVPTDADAATDAVVLSPAEIAEVVSIERDDGAEEGERLQLVGSAERFEQVAGDQLSDAVVEPVEASIELIDDEVIIDGGTAGFEPDPSAAAEVLVEVATGSEPREAELPGEATQPEVTREDAEQLGIVEVVSTFTTDLVPDQPRNENLRLAAENIDGELILPGERFSLNEAIGQRTEERGFVENGFIDEDGDLVEVVGGGVSQMGTTFMNAAWFAGIELVEFQPHSLYFERYPVGREATLSWGAIDVVVENDSPYGILVASEASESEVTVSFWSSPWAQVETETGEPFDEVEGEERDGFTVEFERTITYPDGSTSFEEYVHRYEPED